MRFVSGIAAYMIGAYGTYLGTNGMYYLSAPGKVTTYELPAGSNSLTDDRIRSSVVTLYNNRLGNSAWLPYQTYQYKSTLPSTFIEFPLPPNPINDPECHLNDAQKAVWKLVGTNNKYDNNGTVLTTTKPLSRPLSLVMRSDIGEPMGVITGADYSDCSVFTGDYDLNEEGTYFDKANGWGKGAKYSGGEITVNSTSPHFGQKSLYVKEACGIVKNIKADTKKDYILSAWVKPMPGKPNIRFGVDFYDKDGKYINGWGPPVQNLQIGTWQYVEYKILSSKIAELIPGRSVSEIASYDVWIGRISSDPAGKTEFYMDDVRFYPTNAIVTTTYYDVKWQLPILSIDANNNPGKRILYDDWGRPWKTYKVVNKANDRNTDVELSTIDYFKYSENTNFKLKLTSNEASANLTGNGTYAPGSVVQISCDRHVINNGRMVYFDYWDGTSKEYLADPNAATTNLTIPMYGAELKAVYAQGDIYLNDFSSTNMTNDHFETALRVTSDGYMQNPCDQLRNTPGIKWLTIPSRAFTEMQGRKTKISGYVKPILQSDANKNFDICYNWGSATPVNNWYRFQTNTGWTKFEFILDLTSVATIPEFKVGVKTDLSNPVNDLYIDDIQIQPF
jgi:hypothetical protein